LLLAINVLDGLGDVICRVCAGKFIIMYHYFVGTAVSMFQLPIQKCDSCIGVYLGGAVTLEIVHRC
jgi:hypothetical protein